ncbi:hypothetical protein NQ315_000218 [Exocentrus adspersus]|uniref:Uncharacterized protein n=1 Tax=Exocentrus adspersus TaxID=1586481 RepID=A0AAV8VRF7_9CUCU|nr:hypothetical protein NQ315_000218 [Exocentrus adspersus]
MTKVCRLCLQPLQRGSKYFNINAVESFTGFMPYRDQLTTCIPEMALDLIPNPVICNGCRSALKFSYDFKSRCLLVEKKIREYVESQPSDSVNYDLSQIPVVDLPPLRSSVKEAPQEVEAVAAPAASVDNDSELLLQLQKEVILPATGEIEITNVNASVRGRKRKTEPVDGPYDCNKCGLVFPDVGKLVLHKAVHGDDFVCNFCSKSFKSLQYLRKHNNMCSKMKNNAELNPILTKRPHLPTKAKNHLKRWLFRHTDVSFKPFVESFCLRNDLQHPYPTDLEKQTLMQETNLSLLQVENWFINARRRILQDLTTIKRQGGRCGMSRRGKKTIRRRLLTDCCFLADEIVDDALDLHTEIDLDELSAAQSSPAADTSASPSPSEGGESASVVTELDPLFTPVDIMSIKREVMDDRFLFF